jgi:hypothetical protein
MAKKQSFGDKVLRQRAETRKMAKIVVAERKENGHFRFRTRMIDMENVQDEIKASRKA